jgi:hypothetical protein
MAGEPQAGGKNLEKGMIEGAPETTKTRQVMTE